MGRSGWQGQTADHCQPGHRQAEVTILTAEGGVTNNGIKVKDTAVVDYSLKFNPNDVVLKRRCRLCAEGAG